MFQNVSEKIKIWLMGREGVVRLIRVFLGFLDFFNLLRPLKSSLDIYDDFKLTKTLWCQWFIQKCLGVVSMCILMTNSSVSPSEHMEVT